MLAVQRGEEERVSPHGETDEHEQRLEKENVLFG